MLHACCVAISCRNTYPGCACDIPSVLYCYSFEPYPWTEHFSSQPEILKYLHHCVDKYGLWAHIKLNTRVNEADFDVSSGTWTVATDDAKRSIYRVFVMAQGGAGCKGLGGQAAWCSYLPCFITVHMFPCWCTLVVRHTALHHQLGLLLACVSWKRLLVIR